MTQPAETDFASYARLSESEQEVLERALASIPDDILSTGDRPWIESRIRSHLQKEGVLGDAGGIFQVGEVPAIALVARAVGCLASNYVTLRGISNNQPADAVARSIARAVAGCVTGGGDTVQSDILQHRGKVASALKALGLPSLGDVLLAGDPTG
ncbi:MAG: hypothetical protein ACRDRT_19095 [Pseudonocardiaceae bacterium]